MSKTILANVSDDMMSLATEYSDRYVYSNYFVPVLVTFDDNLTPVIPFYTKQKIIELAQYGIVDPDRVQIILRDLGYAELWNRNAISEAKTRFAAPISPDQGVFERRRAERGLAEVGRAVQDAAELLDVLSPKLQEADRELLALVTRRLTMSAQAVPERGAAADRMASMEMEATRPTEMEATRPTILGKQDVEFIAGLLQSEIGFLFLDRSRVRPVGFALGEHVYALSLAPGEEVTLEQKTFSKRQATFEEQNEQEKQFDIELASAYSTEIQEGFERQKNRTDSWGLTWNLGVGYTSPETKYGQVNANFTVGETRNVTEANQETARRSVKDSQTASSKVAAKYRAQHKTTFRVVSEQGFEATSKRTIRNPNRTTPVTLHYFKVLQRLKMMQERYGVRLCWAPSVKDPAFTFFEKIRKGRQHIIDTATQSLPPRPTEPPAPDPGGATTTTKRETMTCYSPITVADKWGTTGDMSADYNVDIPYSGGYTWDDDRAAVEASINVFTGRKQEDVSRGVVGTPRPIQDADGNKLRVVIHIGAKSWLGGPGISFQVSAKFYKDVTITQQVGQNTAYNDALADYRLKVKEWEDLRDTVLAEAHEAADAFAERMVKQLSPVNEMVSQIIEISFPESVRDEVWEIDYWQRLFDWERASFVAYPSWWSSGETRNPTLDPSDFMNASWAKLYLPVKVGMERLALRWIFGKSLAVPLAKEVEARFESLVKDLQTYRKNVLGAVNEITELTEPCQEISENYRCLAIWHELMPTDGTHIEVIQGATSAADAITGQEIADATELRKALLESEKRSAKLKDKAHDQMTEPATIEVYVGTGDSSLRDQS